MAKPIVADIDDKCRTDNHIGRSCGVQIALRSLAVLGGTTPCSAILRIGGINLRLHGGSFGERLATRPDDLHDLPLRLGDSRNPRHDCDLLLVDTIVVLLITCVIYNVNGKIVRGQWPLQKDQGSTSSIDAQRRGDIYSKCSQGRHEHGADCDHIDDNKGEHQISESRWIDSVGQA
jgi:hypothetical protein